MRFTICRCRCAAPYCCAQLTIVPPAQIANSCSFVCVRRLLSSVFLALLLACCVCAGLKLSSLIIHHLNKLLSRSRHCRLRLLWLTGKGASCHTVSAHVAPRQHTTATQPQPTAQPQPHSARTLRPLLPHARTLCSTSVAPGSWLAGLLLSLVLCGVCGCGARVL